VPDVVHRGVVHHGRLDRHACGSRATKPSNRSVTPVRTLHDAYVAACGRKTPYVELSRAETVADGLTRRSPYGEVLRVYRCPFAPLGDGGHFHVGHVRGTKPQPAVLAAKRRWSAPSITFEGTAEDLPPSSTQPEKSKGRRRDRPKQGRYKPS
jgi:hypothetical protein